MNRGNITNKNVNGTSITFGYSNDGWNNKLTSVNGTALIYDENGNVLTYGDKSFTWADGRNLATITDSSNNDSISYTYNRYGYRTGKTVNGVATNYIVDENGTVVAQKTGNDPFYFEYDKSGTPLGFVYNGVQYLYVTSISNDIIAIADSTGTIVASYTYGDWGECTVDSTSTNLALANLNPLRYRGYYYDNETGYYYLQSRYYDSNICRFISSDLPEFAQFQKNKNCGLNLFSYCCNNPIKYTDHSGNFPYYSWVIGFLIDVIVTLLNPAIASSFDVVGNTLKAYYKSKGKKYAVNYINKRIVPVFSHYYMNNILTAIRIAVKRVYGATLNNIGSTAATLFLNKLVKTIRTFVKVGSVKGITITDIILMMFSIGSFISGILDWISDGKVNERVEIPFVKGWLNYLC